MKIKNRFRFASMASFIAFSPLHDCNWSLGAEQLLVYVQDATEYPC